MQEKMEPKESDGMLAADPLDLVGNTPVVRLRHMTDESMAEVYVKLEKYNPGGSVKDRAVLGMVRHAERSRQLAEGGTLLEATSGNTGISMAQMGRLLGYRVMVVMPENMSRERQAIIRGLGATLVLTRGSEGMKGAIEQARAILRENPCTVMLSQFHNLGNPESHYLGTGPEILRDLPDLDMFVAGVGTGGTISGAGRFLKEKNDRIRVVAVEPEESRVLTGGTPGPHRIQGIGAGFVPEVLNRAVIDEVAAVSGEAAIRATRQLARQEGLFLGISSGAAVAAALEEARKLGPGRKVLALAPDGGERYLSEKVFGGDESV